MKVIKKWRYDSEFQPIIMFHGIEIVNDKTGETYLPVYPFAELENRAALVEFVKLYEKELLDFYKKGWNHNFGRFCIVEEYKDTFYGISRDLDLSMANEFRDRWFKRGVVFY